MLLPTVKIVFGESYIVINESDFDEEKHELFEEPELKEGSVKWLKAQLGLMAVEFPEDAKKADLEELLNAALAG